MYYTCLDILFSSCFVSPQESLDRHVCSCETEFKKQKTRDQSFPCHICGTVLATKYRLTTHLLSAHGKTIHLVIIISINHLYILKQYFSKVQKSTTWYFPQRTLICSTVSNYLDCFLPVLSIHYGMHEYKWHILLCSRWGCRSSADVRGVWEGVPEARPAPGTPGCPLASNTSLSYLSQAF